MSICLTAVLTLGAVTADIAVNVDAGPKEQYLQLRTEIDGTAESHAAVAQKCQQRKLYDEARAHFFAASRLAQHPKDRFLLRQASGDVRVGDDWLSPRDVERLKQLESDRVQAWKRVGSDVVKLRSTLERPADGPRTLATKAAAREELARISSGDQSWLVAAVFIDAEPAASRAAVETLASVPTVASSESLARFAIDSRWSTVREGACEALRERNPRHYAHVWVERLKTPAVVTHQLADEASRFASVWTYETESADIRKRYVHSASVRTEFVWLAGQTREVLAGGNPLGGPINFMATGRGASNRFGHINKRERTSSELKSRELEQMFGEAAEKIDVDNARIVEALQTTAWPDISPDATANEIWAWWRAYNGQAAPPSSAEKELVEVVEEDEEVIPRLPVSTQVGRAHSCFSAGTPVWTSEGPVAIEDLQTGDRVLSSDLDSGALLYATVLYRTERQTDAKYDLDVHSETIQASASHPFWSIDEGWIPAKDTLAGNSLKTAHGVVLLDDVQRLADSDPAVASPVYNLVVDGTHTYFVGQSQCLVHDDTIPRPRDAEAVTSFAFAE